MPRHGTPTALHAMQAEVEFQNASKHGFEQHASQIKTDEGDESEMPSWRLEQIQARKEEEAEDMSELAVVAPKQYVERARGVLCRRV